MNIKGFNEFQTHKTRKVDKKSLIRNTFRCYKGRETSHVLEENQSQ